MAIVEIVRGLISEQMDDLARQIERDFKSAVGAHKRTGQAQNSIHIEKRSEYSYFIGGRDDHLYFLDEGNDQRYSRFGGKRNPASPNYKGEGSMALRFSDGTWHQSAGTYKGFHIAEKVADKYNG